MKNSHHEVRSSFFNVTLANFFLYVYWPLAQMFFCVAVTQDITMETQHKSTQHGENLNIFCEMLLIINHLRSTASASLDILKKCMSLFYLICLFSKQNLYTAQWHKVTQQVSQLSIWTLISQFLIQHTIRYYTILLQSTQLAPYILLPELQDKMLPPHNSKFRSWLHWRLSLTSTRLIG